MIENKPSCLFVHDFKFVAFQGEAFGEGQFEYRGLWKRKYLKHFSQVTVVARGTSVANKKDIDGKYQLTGAGVELVPTVSLASPRGVFKLPAVRRVIDAQIERHDLVIVRLPSIQGLVACSLLKKSNKPYIIEVVSNGFDSLWYHDRFKGKVMAPILHILTKRYIQKAENVIYVTSDYLQRVYPNNRNTIGCSDVIIRNIDEKTLSNRIRKIDNLNKNMSVKIGLVGSYDVMHKGHDTAIQSIANLSSIGQRKIRLHFLGAGESGKWRGMARRQGVEGNLCFDKPLNTGKPMEDWLDSLDILLIPSKVEGMPRILVEAMSRGVPVIGTAVGDIPNILQPEDVFDKNNWQGITHRLTEFLDNKTLMKKSAKYNFQKSKGYELDKLNKKRDLYIEKVIRRSINK